MNPERLPGGVARPRNRSRRLVLAKVSGAARARWILSLRARTHWAFQAASPPHPNFRAVTEAYDRPLHAGRSGSQRASESANPAGGSPKMKRAWKTLVALVALLGCSGPPAATESDSQNSTEQ